ncbi:MAG: pyruvate dehydrogenase complex dihydrolipoamide acetyltransferase [Verrucomicrobiota bacterium]
MPKLSDTMTEGTILRWLKQEGDPVDIGDEIAEIETDKATMALEAFDEGVLAKILVPEGEKAAISTPIAILAEEGEDVSGTAPAATPAAASTPAAEPAPAASPASTPAATPTPTASSSGGDRLKASPLARKIAAAEGIDLASITGSGPGGRIIKRDLEGASSAPPAAQASLAAAASNIASNPAPAATPTTQQPIMPSAASSEDQRIELSSMRKIIADRLLTSKQTIPHFYLHTEVDAGPLMALRKQINAQAEQTTGNKYTVNDFIVKALINACQAVPAVNASFAGDHIIQYGSVGISVAVAIDDGLVTPVVKQAEAKSLLQISREIKDLATRARDKKLKPDEFDGGTITISNLGNFGIDAFDAIVNPPQAAILSVGSIAKKPVVKGDQIVPGQVMNLGLSCDHRVVDGAVGAQFLAEVKKLIENPALMLV